MDFIFDHGVFACQIRSCVHFLCTETASTVSFSLCRSQVERECGVQPLFCFSSDLEGSEWEKNSLRSRKGQKIQFFVRGKKNFQDKYRDG